MKILSLNVFRGPNYWSNYRKNLIALKIDLEDFEFKPSNQIDNFPSRLVELLPSLYEHRCSEGKKGGFIQRLHDGTWLGHVIEHVALELQWLAGMHCGYGRTRQTEREGVYHVIIAYEIEKAGVFAAKTAFKIIEALATQQPYDNLEKDIAKLQRIFNNYSLGVSTKAIVDEANLRDIPYSRVSKNSLIMFGQGVHQKTIWATVTSQTSSMGVDFAANKDLTKMTLRSALIPVPYGVVIHNIATLDDAIESVGLPIVIKPIDGNHGRGITTNIDTKEKAVEAFHLAQKISSKVIIEHFIHGDDYRFLVVNYKLVAVAKRVPAFVKGNGMLTIQALINLVNQDSRRGKGHSNILTNITVDQVTLSMLAEQNLTLDTILPVDKIVYLKHAANLSTGGTAIDVTDVVHPANIAMAERIAAIMKLDICGIDIIAESVEIPITPENGAVIEVNAGPGLRMHLCPSEGKPRNVAKNIVDMLYPEGKPSRIPVVAVTGTNGKTTTVRLIAHIANKIGHKVGFTTTDGIYINNILTYEGDCSGPTSAKVILQDPTVDFAVLECARGGILRSGLGFDRSNVSIILNITEDHLGIGGIDTLDDLARVKSVVARSTAKDGYAILNADDDLVYDIKDDLHCHIALFSLRADNPRISDHCAKNGIAIYLQQNIIMCRKGSTVLPLGDIKDIPLTLDGTASCMYSNVLAAILASLILKFPVTEITKAVREFIPSPKNTPGRMNIFDFDLFKVLVDYGHNVGAMTELQRYLKHIKSNKIIGVISAPGDRRPDDMRQLGKYAGAMFDEIILRHEKDPRGRTNEQIIEWLSEGIALSRRCKKITIIPDELEALQYAMKHAMLGNFIVHFPTEVTAVINYLENITLSHKIPQKEVIHGST